MEPTKNFILPSPDLSRRDLRIAVYTALAVNLRNHDHLFATSRFEDCILDLKAGVARLREEGCDRIVLIGLSLGCTEAVFSLVERHK